ncbi:hypothetical protein L1887_48785 [Cichorium endivia]|nr:hypothetical protein L1887_48785 [Cichorium endivia]
MSLQKLSIDKLDLAGKRVLIRHLLSENPQKACADPAPGSVILLENLRFHVEEEGKGVDEAKNKIKANPDEVANSMVGVQLPQRASGFLMKKRAGLLLEGAGESAATVPGHFGRCKGGRQDSADRKSAGQVRRRRGHPGGRSKRWRASEHDGPGLWPEIGRTVCRGDQTSQNDRLERTGRGQRAARRDLPDQFVDLSGVDLKLNSFLPSILIPNNLEMKCVISIILISSLDVPFKLKIVNKAIIK